jgi:predicted dehydrogenase
VNAVYVATPVGSHLEYALKACAAGKPCYVEKPMTRNTTEAQAMVDAFRAADLPLFIAYYRRGQPRFLKVKELLSSGAIGKLSGVSYRSTSPVRDMSGEAPWRYRPELSGGGLVMDVGCHTLDIIDFLTEPLEEVSGIACNVASGCRVEDNVVMQFRLGSGALGTASWNFAAAIREDMLVFSGTRGRLSTSTFGQEPVKLETESGIQCFDLPYPTHVQQPLITTIVAQLQGSGGWRGTGDTAIRTTRILDTVLDRYYGGRSDQFWKRCP